MSTPRLVTGSSPTTNSEHEEYQTALHSWLFERAPGQAKLFSYICEKYFAGQSEQLKEYTVAAEVFGRSTDFDSRQDPIVRVNINRLRHALRKYYRTEGRNHAIQILIPPGRYVPVFKQMRSATQAGEAANQGLGADGLPEQPTAGTLSPRRWRDSRQLIFGAGVLVGLIITTASIALVWKYGFGKFTPDTLRLASMITSIDPAIRIMCGSTNPAILDELGQVWVGDMYFRGGTMSPVRGSLPLSHPVYRSRREGRFSYRIPLAPGCYELHLHFVETEPKGFPVGGSGRLFDIVLNGQTVERDFDVELQAGGYNTPLSRVFTDVRPAPDGFLAIDFRTSRSWPTLSGIEIIPGTPGRMLPVRLTAQTTTYMADDRTIWRPDHHYTGGRAVTRGEKILATRDPGLFRGERYGSFRYSIPVSPGKYTVRLFFAEAHFGPSNPGGGGEGARLFDVFCNGKALLRDFDVFREAGGQNRALVRSFSGLEPDPRRKLVLDFIASRNNAMVNAIEVVAE